MSLGIGYTSFKDTMNEKINEIGAGGARKLLLAKSRHLFLRIEQKLCLHCNFPGISGEEKCLVGLITQSLRVL